MSAYPRAVCADCGLERALRKDGTLQRHMPPGPHTEWCSDWCSGSGDLPAGERGCGPSDQGTTT